jgi:hypothetical protein
MPVGPTAGESAQQEYERRRARDLERRRALRGRGVALLLVVPPLAFALTHLGATFLRRSYDQAAGGVPVDAMFGPATVNLAAAVLATSAAVAIATALWGPRQTTEAWAKGADGERRTGELLDRLDGGDHVILHDPAWLQDGLAKVTGPSPRSDASAQPVRTPR